MMLTRVGMGMFQQADALSLSQGIVRGEQACR